MTKPSHSRDLPQKMKTFDQIKTHIKMFIAALFIIPPNGKESKCLPTMTGYTNCGTSVRWNIIWE